MFDPTIDAMTLPHCAKGTASCLATRLNVRTKPSMTGAIVGQLDEGQRVVVWALDDGWMIVQTVDGLTGWASAAYLRVEGELEA